ncbi:hypothetical protein [Flavobacterium chungangensis]|uniref:Uncharacterized protein n=1 Tax=Flavobacterium chungangensis TaxID=2708132 RepID=A0ABV8ZFJ8_9FLAO
MKLKIVLICLFTTLLSQAQTKVIAHKSHSGSSNSFAKAYQNNLFNINSSNFGTHEINFVRLDTVIIVNKSLTVIKYRQSKSTYYDWSKYDTLKESDFIHMRDTLVNDPVLNKKNILKLRKSSKTILMQTPINKIVFIGLK